MHLCAYCGGVGHQPASCSSRGLGVAVVLPQLGRGYVMMGDWDKTKVYHVLCFAESVAPALLNTGTAVQLSLCGNVISPEDYNELCRTVGIVPGVEVQAWSRDGTTPQVLPDDMCPNESAAVAAETPQQGALPPAEAVDVPPRTPREQVTPPNEPSTAPRGEDLTRDTSAAETTTTPRVRPILRTPPNIGQWSADTPTPILPSATADGCPQQSVLSVEPRTPTQSKTCSGVAPPTVPRARRPSEISDTEPIERNPSTECGPLLQDANTPTPAKCGTRLAQNRTVCTKGRSEKCGPFLQKLIEKMRNGCPLSCDESADTHPRPSPRSLPRSSPTSSPAPCASRGFQTQGAALVCCESSLTTAMFVPQCVRCTAKEQL